MDRSVDVLVGNDVSVGWIVAVIVGSGSGVSVIGNGVFVGGWEVVVGDAGEVVAGVFAVGFMGLQAVNANEISKLRISAFRIMFLQQISGPEKDFYFIIRFIISMLDRHPIAI